VVKGLAGCSLQVAYLSIRSYNLFFWQNKKHTHVIQLLDVLLVGLGFLGAYWCKKYMVSFSPVLTTSPNYYVILFLLVLTSYLSFASFKLHEPCVQGSLFRRIIKVWMAVGVSVVVLIVMMFVLHQHDISRLLLGLHFLFASTLCSIRLFVSDRRSRLGSQGGKHIVKVLVVGSRERAKETIISILESPGSHYHILGCVELSPDDIGKKVVGDIEVIADMRDFKQLLLNRVVDDVIFAIPLKQIPNIIDQISFAEKLGVNVRIMPDWQIQKIMFRPETASISFENYAGLPCLSLSSTPKEDTSLLVKSFIDIAGSMVGIVLISPLLLTIAALVKLTSRGPVFFSQERVGLNGRRFMVHKFRTMVVNAEALKADLAHANEMDGPVFKIKNDPRVTKIGNFLRKTSLDELPQLFNVAKGEMSLVGPRPPLPKEVDEYLPCHRRRLSMRPGITCIWQVSGRNNIDFTQWMKLDLKYIDDWSLWLDAKLLLLTVRAVVGGSGS
jgi:exopolysaccharide biosynthesis polyprenyl glycosylphosphotransferase